MRQRLNDAPTAAPAAAPGAPASLHASWTVPSHSPAKLAAVVQVLAEHGVSERDALAGTGIDAAVLHDADALTSTAQLWALIRRAARLSDADDLGLRVGLRLRVSSYGMYGYALLCAASLRSGLEFAQKYQALANPLLPFRWEARGDRLCHLFPAFDALDLPQLDARLYRLLVEMQMAIQATLTLDAMGPWCLPSRALFSWPRTAHHARLAQAFGCELQFGAPRCELQYPLAWLDRAPQLANALTAAQTSQACARLLASVGSSSSQASRVYGELMRSPGRFPDIESVAARLGMTGRTLRRHLQAEGSSYADLLAQVRRALAEDYLRSTRMSMEDVAAALSFSDARSFRHAFVRWTGQPPSAYRRAPEAGH